MSDDARQSGRENRQSKEGTSYVTNSYGEVPQPPRDRKIKDLFQLMQGKNGADGARPSNKSGASR